MYNITVDASLHRHQQDLTASIVQRQPSAGNDVMLDMPSTSSSQQEGAGKVGNRGTETRDRSLYMLADNASPLKAPGIAGWTGLSGGLRCAFGDLMCGLTV